MNKFNDIERLLDAIWNCSDLDDGLSSLVVDISVEVLLLKDEFNKLLPKENPLCPHCQSEMLPKMYEGYYDNFPCWICECEESEFYTKNTFCGAYR